MNGASRVLRRFFNFDDLYDILNEVLTIYTYIPLESAVFELLNTGVSGH